MEKIPCICQMRELCKAISELEDSLVDIYGITLNEAMVMCCIGSENIAAGDISQAIGMKSSHLSKVLRSIEEKGLITRAFGDKDKRQIYFSLTPEATSRLCTLKCDGIPIPDMLKTFFK
ncbi:MAG: winged helix DNA-binding protein [Bacteroidaceae bacterium]|nr:winged helix DNA-binding protein [Bacteroidaceae bacterium]